VNEEWTEADDVVEEVREIRRRIWAEFDNDVARFVAHIQEREKRLPSSAFAPPRNHRIDRVA
jgi:hypothetical protein